MKNIVILATGGTIAGAGEQGKDIGYKSGSIKAQEIEECGKYLRRAVLQYQFGRCYFRNLDCFGEADSGTLAARRC